MNRLTFIFCLLSILCIESCKKSPPPSKTSDASTPLVITIGGLGHSQLGDIDALVITDFPSVSPVRFGPQDGWKADVAEYCNTTVYSGKSIWIAHSMGCRTACLDARKVAGEVTLILLDPAGFSEADVPINAKRCVVVRADATAFIFRADIHGLFERVEIHRPHNDLPHDHECITLVRKIIAETL